MGTAQDLSLVFVTLSPHTHRLRARTVIALYDTTDSSGFRFSV